MQNVQNAAEIQQRVINLVELYRTKVGKESEVAHYLANEYQRQYDQEINVAYDLHEHGYDFYMLNIELNEDAVNSIKANEQLLGFFYKTMAGEKADKEVLSQFLAEQYDTSIFSEEEECFLKSHFTELVNYIIMTPNNDLSSIGKSESNDRYLIPTEVLSFIKEQFSIPSGAKIFNPFTGYAQLACLYKDCSFICEESYSSYFKRWNTYCDKAREEWNEDREKLNEKKLNAWMKLAIFANNLDAFVVENGAIPTTYDAIVSYVPVIPSSIPEKAYSTEESSDPDIINKILISYKNLAEGGKMLLVLPSEFCYEKRVLWSGQKASYKLELDELWKQLFVDNSLVEIIQLPSIMGKSLYKEDGYCIIIAEKGYRDDNVTFIDASFASINSENERFDRTLDLDSLHSMIENGGTDNNTGLRKLVKISRNQVKQDLLMPQVYVIEKPSDSERPESLASLSSLVTSRIYDLDEDLPKETPRVSSNNLSPIYVGSLNTETLRKAGLPNNPTGWKYGTQRLSPWSVGADGSGITDKDVVISDYRNCRYLDGSKDAVLFEFAGNGINTALIYATGKPIAVDNDIHVLYPNDGIDALSLLAILRLPIVYWQLQTYRRFGLYGPDGLINNVMVPTDRRIIGDEMLKMKREESVIKEMKDKAQTMKTEYINEVRMRKHDMGQYIFELGNIEDLMRFYLENRDNEKDYCQQLESLLDNFRSSLGELSILLDNLSKEEVFGEPEPLNLNDYLSQLQNRYKADGFKVNYECDEASIRQYNKWKIFRNLDNQPNPDDDYAHQPAPEDDHANQPGPKDAYTHQPTPEDDYAHLPAPEDDYTHQPAPEDDYIHQPAPEDDHAHLPALKDNRIARGSSIGFNGHSLDSFNMKSAIPFIYVARNDIQRMINNIIDNARKHGFTDSTRKDYVVKVRLSMNVEKNMFQIDFCNNGNPLPEGMNKMRYGIKGEKAGKTAGTGIGGNYVKSFVEHYGGDYDIFMEDGWTVVRICLPI
jgi:signal transduction histidine kinase